MTHASQAPSGASPAASSGQPFINGSFTPGRGDPLPVENPATEEIFAEVETCSAAQVEEAVSSARRSFDEGTWSRADRATRASALLRMAQFLDDQRKELAATLQAEAGATAHHLSAQVEFPMRHTRQIVDLYMSLPEEENAPRPLADAIDPGRVALSVLRYEPAGVVTSISAYNHPLYLNIWKTWPALLAGNSVILRPSPFTPLTSLFFARAASEAGLPPGVFNLVIEGGPEGAQTLTRHPDVDMVSFTGSSVVGRQIMHQGADTVKKILLELGGKSVQLYLPDAVDKAVAGAVFFFNLHSGQACIAPTRLLVPARDKDRVVAEVAAAASKLAVGDPADPATVLGPLISGAQVRRCADYVAAAVAAGAKVAAGGGAPGHLDRGHYFEPTVLDVPDNSNPAAQEEIFGPVLCVLGYDDLDHAVAIANDSVYGLAGQVYSSDLPRAVEVASRIRAGSIMINGGAVHAFASSGGYKQSGVGRERGIEGIRAYQEIKHISVANP